MISLSLSYKIGEVHDLALQFLLASLPLKQFPTSIIQRL